MKHTVKDFTLELIDEPLQRHCVAWERAVRKEKNQDIKPLLANVMAQLNLVRVTETNMQSMIGLFQLIADSISTAMKIMEENESVTLSADYGIMVRAAISSGWVVSPELKEENVDEMKPWLVKWIARKIGDLYEEVNSIPKN